MQEDYIPSNDPPDTVKNNHPIPSSLMEQVAIFRQRFLRECDKLQACGFPCPPVTVLASEQPAAESPGGATKTPSP